MTFAELPAELSIACDLASRDWLVWPRDVFSDRDFADRLRQTVEDALRSTADRSQKNSGIIKIDFQFRCEPGAETEDILKRLTVALKKFLTTDTPRIRRLKHGLYSLDIHLQLAESHSPLSTEPAPQSLVSPRYRVVEEDVPLVSGPPLAVPEVDEQSVSQYVGFLMEPLVAPTAGDQQIIDALAMLKQAEAAYQRSCLLRFQAMLDAIAGRALPTPAENKLIVQMINGLRRPLGVALTLKETGDPIYLGCVLSRRANKATIQAVSADRSRVTLHAASIFPAIQALQRDEH